MGGGRPRVICGGSLSRGQGEVPPGLVDPGASLLVWWFDGAATTQRNPAAVIARDSPNPVGPAS